MFRQVFESDLHELEVDGSAIFSSVRGFAYQSQSCDIAAVGHAIVRFGIQDSVPPSHIGSLYLELPTF